MPRPAEPTDLNLDMLIARYEDRVNKVKTGAKQNFKKMRATSLNMQNTYEAELGLPSTRSSFMESIFGEAIHKAITIVDPI